MHNTIKEGMFFINGQTLKKLWDKGSERSEEESELLSRHLKAGKIFLNPRFLSMRKAWDNIFEINHYFKTKLSIHEAMLMADNKYTLKTLETAWKSNEYKIQELFHFEKNSDFHRFWEMPKCACPSMDNQELWGTKQTIYSYDCPYHGEQ